MAFIFRPSTFNNLKPLIRQRYAMAAFNTFRPQHRLLGSLPETSRADFHQLVSNQTHVSTTLATRLLSENYNSNVVFSPLSILAVLSLAAVGSKGRTLDQFLALLKTNDTDELNSLYSQLVSTTLVDGSPKGGPRLSFANGLWVEKSLSLKPSFKKVVDTDYKAACEQVDFKTKAVEVVDKVNLWAAKHTNGLIKQVIDASSVNELTRLIFANAVYFKGAWSQEFDKKITKESDFHLLHGSKIKVPFMTSYKRQFVNEYDDFKVLGLPYRCGQDEREFTMYVFLPHAKDGLQSLLQKVGSTSDFLDRHIPHQKVEVKRLLIPKFKISFDFEVTCLLKKLGLVLPFNNDCDDLTEVADLCASDQNLYVSSIFHKSIVEVCEEGTEAAAVTTTGMFETSSWKPKKIDFVADHPFLFVIREDVSGVVLFMGQVVEPRVN